MFSALSKLVSFVYQHDDDEEEHYETDQTIAVPIDKIHQEPADNRQSTRTDQVKNFSGKVTHVFEKHGLINRDIYFSFDTIINEVKPQIGDEVDVVARQQGDDGLLITEQVSIIQESWDTNNDEECIEEVEVLPQDGIVGKITRFDGEKGLINGHISFKREDLYEDFIPYVGDYIKAEYDENDKFIERMEPLRYLEKESKITGFQGDHGYLDGEIFFYPEACVDGYKPVKWDKVTIKAIESAQGRCNWRAVSIKPWKMPVVNQYVLYEICLMFN